MHIAYVSVYIQYWVNKSFAIYRRMAGWLESAFVFGKRKTFHLTIILVYTALHAHICIYLVYLYRYIKGIYIYISVYTSIYYIYICNMYFSYLHFKRVISLRTVPIKLNYHLNWYTSSCFNFIFSLIYIYKNNIWFKMTATT